MQDKYASLKLAVKHNELKLVKDIIATEQTIQGLVVNFDFRTPEWAELTKTASFIRDGKSYLVLLDAVDDCFIPWECLESKGTFTVGVFGVADGVRLTTNVLRFNVAESCMCEGEEPAEPTPEIYEQILALCGEANRVAQSVRDDANAGKFDGKDGIDGKDGVNGRDGRDGVNGTNGKDGISATHSWNGTILTISSASGTSSANLKGEQGAKGDQGVKGEQGPKGDKGDPFSISKVYTSVNAMNAGFATDGVAEGEFVVIETGNVDDADNAKLYIKGTTQYIFITDLSGAQGIQGPQGERGEQGIQGLQGERGIRGEDGVDGYTPVRGTDYWTEADKAEIVDAMASEGFVKDTDLATDEKAGIVRFATYEDVANIASYVAMSPFDFDYALKDSLTHEITDKENTSTWSPISASAVWGYVDSAIGDIDSALDAILAIQETIVGGVN